MQKISVKGHVAQKMEWKETDTTDRITLPDSEVGKE